MEIKVLADHKLSHYGKYTGHDTIPEFLTMKKQVFVPQESLAARLHAMFYTTFRNHPNNRKSYVAAELAFLKAMKQNLNNDVVGYILNIDAHLGLLTCFDPCPKNLIATIMRPPTQWEASPERIKEMKKLSSAIVMSENDINYFEQHVGKGRVKFAQLGVNTDFFCPSARMDISEIRLFYVAGNSRNTKMLERVVEELIRRRPELKFDFLVPNSLMSFHNYDGLRSHPNVMWHQGISDDDMLKLYQNSYLFLCPMGDHESSNAFVEALACGLPIVATKGGTKSYGGDSIFPLVENNDDEAMVALVEKFIDDRAWRDAVAKDCREFALQYLSWPIAAAAHERACQELMQ